MHRLIISYQKHKIDYEKTIDNISHIILIVKAPQKTIIIISSKTEDLNKEEREKIPAQLRYWWHHPEYQVEALSPTIDATDYLSHSIKEHVARKNSMYNLNYPSFDNL